MQGPYAFINERPQPYPLLNVEGGKLVAGVGGSYLGARLGASIGIGACMLVFGIPTAGAGALACVIVGGAAGGLGGPRWEPDLRKAQAILSIRLRGIKWSGSTSVWVQSS